MIKLICVKAIFSLMVEAGKLSFKVYLFFQKKKWCFFYFDSTAECLFGWYNMFVVVGVVLSVYHASLFFFI